MTDLEKWIEEFAAIESVGVWNRNVLPWMHERGDEYKRVAHREAKIRGYEYDPILKCYRMPWKMFALKGRNCIAAGWQMGFLRLAFAGKGGPRFYVYCEVPEDVLPSLQRHPFPDRRFVELIKRKGYGCLPE